ncbi:ferredoxin--nitrite reductase [Persephonella sp.]
MEKLIKVSQERNKKLNKIELLKQEHTPREAWERLEEYAEKGFSSIPEYDLNYFFKCFGVFYRPATPERFMIRVRVPGGRLTYDQAVKIGELAQKYGNDYIDLTTRMQVELRYIRIEDLPVVLRELESVGITTFQTGVDNFRNIVQDPLDGVAFDNVIQTWDILLKMQDIFLKKEEWICKLPRKFNISISGSFSNRCNVFGHDACFVLAEKDGVFGFNVFLGGKVGAVARPADVFLLGEEVPPFFEALGRVFKKYGFKDSRNKNRLKYLIDAVGMEELIKAVEIEGGKGFRSAGTTLTPVQGGDKTEKIQLKDGTFAVHMVVPSGIFSGSAIIGAAEVSKEYGSGEIRLTVEQNLYILGIPEEKMEKALSQPVFRKYKNRHSVFFSDLIACAGTEHCPFGVIPNKPDAIDTAQYLTEKFPDLDGKIRMYWSACQKGCGIHGLGDLGFVGVKFRQNGKAVLGVDIHIGGTVTKESEEGKLLIKNVPLEKIKYFIEELVIEFERLRKSGEPFEEFYKRVLTRISKEAVRFLVVFNNLMREKGINLRIEINDLVIGKSSEEEEIFGFGFQLYRKITGKNPYSRPNILEIYDEPEPEKPSKITDIPKQFEKVIMRMISKNPQKRFKVFTEVEEELKSI